MIDMLQTPAEMHAAPSTAGSVVGAAGDDPASPMNTTDDTPTLAHSSSNIGADVAGALPNIPTEVHAAPSMAGTVSPTGDCVAAPMITTGSRSRATTRNMIHLAADITAIPELQGFNSTGQQVVSSSIGTLFSSAEDNGNIMRVPGLIDLLQTPAEMHAPSTMGSVVGAAGDDPASPMNTADDTPTLPLSGNPFLWSKCLQEVLCIRFCVAVLVQCLTTTYYMFATWLGARCVCELFRRARWRRPRTAPFPTEFPAAPNITREVDSEGRFISRMKQYDENNPSPRSFRERYRDRRRRERASGTVSCARSRRATFGHAMAVVALVALCASTVSATALANNDGSSHPVRQANNHDLVVGTLDSEAPGTPSRWQPEESSSTAVSGKVSQQQDPSGPVVQTVTRRGLQAFAPDDDACLQVRGGWGPSYNCAAEVNHFQWGCTTGAGCSADGTVCENTGVNFNGYEVDILECCQTSCGSGCGSTTPFDYHTAYHCVAQGDGTNLCTLQDTTVCPSPPAADTTGDQDGAIYAVGRNSMGAAGLGHEDELLTPCLKDNNMHDPVSNMQMRLSVLALPEQTHSFDPWHAALHRRPPTPPSPLCCER
jgi:hypothetical protein